MNTDPSAWRKLAQRLDSNAVRLYKHPDKRLAEMGRDCALAAELIRNCVAVEQQGGMPRRDFVPFPPPPKNRPYA